MHLGLDIAAGMYSELRAPANGLILYADAPVSDDNGYLGNWCGWPAGGGNTVCMVVMVNGKLYGVTFAHLSSNIYVYPGQQVHQGDLLALTGNSGNSTGPHTHVEVFEIHISLDELITYFSQTADFSFGCGWSAPGISGYARTRIRPESVF